MASGCEKLGGCLEVEGRHAATIAPFGSDAQINETYFPQVGDRISA